MHKGNAGAMPANAANRAALLHIRSVLRLDLRARAETASTLPASGRQRKIALDGEFSKCVRRYWNALPQTIQNRLLGGEAVTRSQLLAVAPVDAERLATT